MTFTELVKILRELRSEIENAKKEYEELKPLFIELVKELKRLNDNLERRRGCQG